MTPRLLFGLMLVVTLMLGGAGGALANTPSATPPTSGTPTTNPSDPLAGPKDNAQDVAAAASLEWLGECWLCPIFKILDDTRKSFATPACQYISSQVIVLVPITLGIFMMVSAAMMLLPFGAGKSASSVLSGMMGRTFLVIVVAGLLYDCRTFNTYISGPIYTMGIKASQTAMNVGIGAHTVFGLKTDCVDPLATGGGTEASFFCMLEVASKTIGLPIRFGMNIIKEINEMGWWEKILNSPSVVVQWLMSVTMIVIGALIVITYFMLNVDFALYTTIFEVLSSFYVLMFLHPTTRGFAISSLKGLFASAVGLFLASIILTAQIAIIAYVVDVHPDLNSVEDIAKYVVDGGDKDKTRGFGDTAFLMLLAGQLIINAAMAGVAGQAKSLVAAGSNIGIPQMGGDFAEKFQQRVQEGLRGVGGALALGAYQQQLRRENSFTYWRDRVWKPAGRGLAGKLVGFGFSPIGYTVRKGLGMYSNQAPQGQPQQAQQPQPRTPV
ncbi:MAG: hypothetical protein ACKO43_03930 [Alphaproteobacteria bacterium]